jgi:hypothetical protein
MKILDRFRCALDRGLDRAEQRTTQATASLFKVARGLVQRLGPAR